jgi:hypothetical protein
MIVGWAGMLDVACGGVLGFLWMKWIVMTPSLRSSNYTSLPRNGITYLFENAVEAVSCSFGPERESGQENVIDNLGFMCSFFGAEGG